MKRAGRPFYARLWDRRLGEYPAPAARYWFLAIVVLSTITLYYQQYVSGAVAPSLLAHFQITFRFYLNVVVISSVAGAVASLIAGLANRWGRANIVVGGLLVASLITAFAIPVASSAVVFATLVSIVGFVEGMVLVATPALVRDFSPQIGRGSAMGAWALGPIVASLTVAEVASNTLGHLHPWQDQYHIAGFTGLAVVALALVSLRELAPNLRDQLMVSLKERVLLEARALGIDTAETMRRPWRQMSTWSVVLPAVGVSLFLLIYFGAVGFFVIYFNSVFGFSQAQANSLGNWFWAADAIALIVIGTLSDRIRVRKPFIFIGGLGAVVMTAIFATRATHAHTSYTTFVIIISILSVFRGTAYAPWMAAFTETVERRNPALIATGLAIWGWLLRSIAAISFLVIPFVVTAVSPIADYGTHLQAILAKYGPEVATLRAIDPATRAALQHNQHDTAAILAAISQISAHDHITKPQAITRLLAARSVPAVDRSYLFAHGQQVLDARQQAPHQWRTWWWVCAGSEVLFLPTIFFLVGRWRPSTARRDSEEHDRIVDEELAELARGTDTSAGAAAPG
jgi:MFS family permease